MLITSEEETVIDLGVESGDFFMIEQSLNNETEWPRDKIIKYKEKEWRNFEIGDKIDAWNKDSNDWQLARIIGFKSDLIQITFQTDSNEISTSLDRNSD